jgi:predicted chitinase
MRQCPGSVSETGALTNPETPAVKITFSDLLALCPNADITIANGLIRAMPATLPHYGITTGLRFAHFIAQAAHETDGLTTLREAGGAAYFERSYGPGTRRGKRLGNTQKGDGARFAGRGIFMLTGRTNYGIFGKKIGIDLVATPERASDPGVSLTIACEYWRARGLNALADRDDVVEITARINGGDNGLASRERYLEKAKALWVGRDAPPPPAPLVDPREEEIPSAPIALDPAPSDASSPTVLGAVTAVAGSGAFGTLTFIQSWYALAAFGLVIVAAGVVWWDWRKRRDRGMSA